MKGYRYHRIYLELTNACNCACQFCPHSVMTRPLQSMPFESAAGLVRQIKEHCLAPRIVFHVMGEPSLYPEVLEIVQLTHALGMATSLATNGIGLGGDFGERLTACPVDELILSIQTPDASSFRARRAPITFKAYQQGILRFIEYAYPTRRHGDYVLRFMSTFLADKLHSERSSSAVMRASFTELRSAMALWIRAFYRALAARVPDTERALRRFRKVPLHRWRRIRIYPGLILEVWPLLDWMDWSQQNNAQEVTTGDCHHWHDHIAVLSNGEVVQCCLDFNGRTALGNTHRASLVDILNGQILTERQKQWAQHKVTPRYCRHCLAHWQHDLYQLRRDKSTQATQQALRTTWASDCDIWSDGSKGLFVSGSSHLRPRGEKTKGE